MQQSSKLQLELPEEVGYDDLLSLCYKKQSDFHSHLVSANISEYEMLYKSLIIYKQLVGLPYGGLHFVLNWTGERKCSKYVSCNKYMYVI